jgi:Ca-activated chloride channel homolog
LRAVTAPGDYDVRYVLELAGSRIIKAVQPLTITAASASLAAPLAASGAEPLSIEWTGPGNPGDYIDVVPAGYATTSGEIAYAYTASGNPVKFSAPGAAGAYEIRYVIEGPGGRKVLTSSPLAVTLPVANLTAPETARKNAKLIVEYEGPMRSGDYIDLVKKGFVATSGELSYFYADGKSANELEMPAEAGAYEIRYVMEAPGGRIILDRQAIEVR